MAITGHHRVSVHAGLLRAWAVLTLLLALGVAAPAPAMAQDMSSITSGARVEINAHGVCRRVHNGTSSGVMVPLKSSLEWSVGSSAFLQNVPSGMTAYACVTPEVALRRWSRPGPPDNIGQPITVNGSDHSLTFTSVGTSTDGVVPTLVGNQIRYTPKSSRWLLGYLQTYLDTVPFEAIDLDGVAVAGTLKVTLVGYQEGYGSFLFRYNPPDQSPELEYGSTSQISGTSKPGVLVNMIFRVSNTIFNGELATYGLFSLGFQLGNFLVIDNSPSSMATYSGPLVGDVNGDGTSNTILDAQIKAGLDFVDLMIANRQSEVGTYRLSGLNDPESYVQISTYGIGNPSPSGTTTGSSTEMLWIFTASDRLTFKGQSDPTSYTSYRTTARAALLGIRASGVALQAARVFSDLDTEVARLVPSYFAGVVHFLSPGANTGVAPNVTRFNQTGTGQLGTPIFSYFTGSNTGSTQATFISSLDHAGSRRHLSSPSVFGSASPPVPVVPEIRLSRADNGSYLYVRDQNGDLFLPQITATSMRNMFAYSARLLPTASSTCYMLHCQPAGVASNRVNNYTGFRTAKGTANNEVALHVVMLKVSIYRVHRDRYASLFNSGGIMWTRGVYIPPDHTSLPPN